MKYRLVYTRRAERDISKLAPDVRRRIGKRILEMCADPLHYADPLIDSRIGTYRFRIGDYRVIFDIVGTDIVILRVGHRREIYRK